MFFYQIMEDAFSASSKEDLFGILQRTADHHDFSNVSYIVSRPEMPHEGGLISLMSTSNCDFAKAYREENLMAVDPVIYRSAATGIPFYWTDCPEFDDFWRRPSGPRAGAVKVMEVASAFEFTNGLVVPSHSIHCGQLFYGLTTFFWKNPGEHLGKLAPQTQRIEAVVRIVHEKFVRHFANESTFTGQLEFPTDRERDCLCWTARGKTSHEVAEILGISRRTVEQHIASVVKRYGVSNKVQAIVSALRLGHIRP